MPSTLPYLSSPGSLKTALDAIREAATPEKVTQDFVWTVLGIKGGTGTSIIPYLKKVGMVASDGSPTELYKQFRIPTAGKQAAAKAILHGYKALSDANEYFYKLPDNELIELLARVTGNDHDSTVAKCTFGTLKHFKSYASFEERAEKQPIREQTQHQLPPPPEKDRQRREEPTSLGLNLAYTINLNLPATSDQAVFNAIFKSLRENLLREE